MKEEIYTIPLNEAFDKDSECPFCELRQNLEAEVLDYIMGPSYMEEDIREETNKFGFCQKHYDKIFNYGNRLGAALMIHTHLLKVREDLHAAAETPQNAKGFFKKNDYDHPVCKHANKVITGCYACKKEEKRMEGYLYTFYYLWKTEEEFRNKVKSCKGFCLDHMSKIISNSDKHLNTKRKEELISTILSLQEDNLKRISDDLDWFIKKFDYRYADMPWKSSKDAVERAITKLSGK